MAISVAILVGEQGDAMALRLREIMAELRPGPYDDPGASFGPLVSRAARERFGRLVASARQEGAIVLLDGSEVTVSGYEGGNWAGATLVDGVTESMAVYREEVFGPLVCLMRAASLDEAIAIINRNPYGNGTAIFTSSGGAAQRFCRAVDVGNVGVNVPIPVPLSFFSFTGRRGSFHGDLHACGKEAIRFYTQAKTITSRWLDEQASGSGSYLTHIGAPPS
jgi:malonate-semialdehyde dehydrogenase (acetylating)/methylmalonate-semialdehyde dehydrogenase